MLLRAIHRLSYLEEHHRAAISAGLAALVACFFASWVTLPMTLIAGWDAYAVSFLALAWTRIITARPATVMRVATLEHSSRRILVVFLLVAACASLGAVAYLLGSAENLSGSARTRNVVLAMATVTASWLVIHTLFTLQYAYLFHRCADANKPPGLDFPGDRPPDYLDFAYFSFVIGMTSQVSDVQIVSQQIRRWALLHGVVSFGFNLVILGFSINVIAGRLPGAPSH